jgi:hypothetical protein
MKKASFILTSFLLSFSFVSVSAFGDEIDVTKVASQNLNGLKCYYIPFVARTNHTEWQLWLLRKLHDEPCPDYFIPQYQERLPVCDQASPEDMVSCISGIEYLSRKITFDYYLHDQLKNDSDLQKYLQEPDHEDYKVQMDKPSLPKLFDGPSGTSEDYTIGEHTSRVLRIYENQKMFYPLSSMNVPSYIRDRERFMKYLLTYHDIGKSISATLYGDNSHEIQYSYPLAWRLMLDSKFSTPETRLAVALINRHKVLGDFMRGLIPRDEVVAELKQSAQFAGATPIQFFNLLEVLFVADAGSYPVLQQQVFGLAEESMTVTTKMTYANSQSAALMQELRNMLSE